MKKTTVLNTDYNDPTIIKQYSAYPVIHQVVGKPQFLKFIGPVKRKQILDFGCGRGHITAELNSRGANCIGADPSPAFITEAKKDYPKLDFRIIQKSKLRGLKSNHFDKVILSMVLPNVNSKQEFKTLFRESSKVLKVGGELILSTTHPSTIRNLEDGFRKMRVPSTMHYFDTGAKFQTRLLLPNKTFMTFTDSHWTLEDISNELAANNLVIVSIKEPRISTSKHWKLLKGILDTPYYIFIKAAKIGSRNSI